jgi:hypothetical protein
MKMIGLVLVLILDWFIFDRSIILEPIGSGRDVNHYADQSSDVAWQLHHKTRNFTASSVFYISYCAFSTPIMAGYQHHGSRGMPNNHGQATPAMPYSIPLQPFDIQNYMMNQDKLNQTLIDHNAKMYDLSAKQRDDIRVLNNFVQTLSEQYLVPQKDFFESTMKMSVASLVESNDSYNKKFLEQGNALIKQSDKYVEATERQSKIIEQLSTSVVGVMKDNNEMNRAMQECIKKVNDSMTLQNELLTKLLTQPSLSALSTPSAPIVATPAPIVATPAPIVATPAPIVASPAPIVAPVAPIVPTVSKPEESNNDAMETTPAEPYEETQLVTQVVNEPQKEAGSITPTSEAAGAIVELNSTTVREALKAKEKGKKRVHSEDLAVKKSKDVQPKKTEEPTAKKPKASPAPPVATKKPTSIASVPEKEKAPKKTVELPAGKSTTPGNSKADTSAASSKLTSTENQTRNFMMKLQHFLNMEANEAIKSVFEFIADWGMNSAAGTVFVFPGPNSKGVDDTHSYHFTIGIHVGLMKIILDTFIAYFEDNQPFKNVQANVDKFVTSVKENSGHFLFKEHAETMKVDFPDDLRDRFHLPIKCPDFKSGDIIYLRINSFWDVMIALNKRSEPVPLELEKLVDLAQTASELPPVIHVYRTANDEVKQEIQLNLFEPLSVEQKGLLKKMYDPIFRRNPGEAKVKLNAELLKKDPEYAKEINAKGNAWRLDDKTNQDASKHWFSDEPVLNRKELTEHFSRVKEDQEDQDEQEPNVDAGSVSVDESEELKSEGEEGEVNEDNNTNRQLDSSEHEGQDEDGSVDHDED